MALKGKWEQWVDSEAGRRALEPSILKPGNQQYLYNRLYRAFHADTFPLDGKMETKAENLLKKVATLKGNYLPQRIRLEIENYLKQQ